ncbi:MAG TPA: NADH-quinone oxidoreductase subunit C [Dehalococcoidia bacterium]|nr:NADH-quinone oxidoreductase subunit C [Dehalococcoidia bacterium]
MAEARAERDAAAAPLPTGSQERIDQMTALLRSAAPSISFEASANATGEVIATVDPAAVLVLCQAAKSNPELAFDHLRFISGIDQMDDGIEIVYSLWSYTKRRSLFIKTLLAPAALRVESVAGVWSAADWHERETAEMFGVIFEGHPEMKHLLLDDDMQIHPLLKAHPLAPIEIKQGVNAF